MIRFIHAADFHLDSAFGALTVQQAAARRRESRELLLRLANYANTHEADLVLLAGDLFDSGSTFRETGEQLAEALASLRAPVFIAPGNHDWYGPGSPYAALTWPENVHIFRGDVPKAVELPGKNVTVWGAAFRGPEQPEGLLQDFHAPEDGRLHLMVLHGDLDAPSSPYNPITKDQAAASALAYLALGHIHKGSGPLTCGKTVCAYPGCPEGRGFDELGEKGFLEGTVDDAGRVSLHFVPFARRRYEIREVDVTGKDPHAAIESTLPESTASDLYRIILTGETDERGVDLSALQADFADRFYVLQLRDHTRIGQDIWARAEEDSLRGLFLRELKDKLEAAGTPEERETVTRAARFGLAALDHRDIV